MKRLARLFQPPAPDPVHFLHIGKTGGTAIIDALNPVASRFGIVLHAHSTRMSDIPSGERVFFFLRHPASRFTSGFFSRLRRGAPRYNYEWSEGEAKAFARFQSANDLAEGLSAEHAETRECAQEAMRSIGHVRTSYHDWFSGKDELDERADSIVLVGLQETLAQDFEQLKALLNLPESLSLPKDDVRSHRTPAEFERRLSQVGEQNIRQWYAADIAFYEHCLRLRSARGQSLATEANPALKRTYMFR